MSKTTGHLVLKGFAYEEQLPCYQGDLNGEGFPVLMSAQRIPQARLWVCAAARRITQKDADAAARGGFGRALPHIHTADSAYLLIGEAGAVTAEVTLGACRFTLESPAAAFIPAGMAHSIRLVAAEAGRWGGVVKICYNGRYHAMPAPEAALAVQDTERYVCRGYHWSAELAGHKGQVAEKGYPILLSTQFMREAKTWICPALSARSEAECAALRAGAGAGATPHYHDNGDEMYMILGEEGSVTIRTTLNGEEHIVTPPAAVYMPAYVSHTLDGIDGAAGLYGGPCAIFEGPLYFPIPTK